MIFTAATNLAFAWDDEGHQIVALIAESHLTAAARQDIGGLLASEGKTSLADVATWADRIRAVKIPRQPDHIVRIPLNNLPYDPERDCKENTCVIAALLESIRVLSDHKAPIEARAVALNYVVHFVGDIHQPLHASANAGLVYKVTINGKESTLHSIWDGWIIARQGHDPKTIANEVDRSMRSPSTGGDPVTWATESRDIARDEIFAKLGTKPDAPVVLGDDYLDASWRTVSVRLLQAGRRLAEVLNTVAQPH